MDYKETLNLPKTRFPMRANLSAREPEILARWQAEGLYQRLLHATSGGERYVLHDGPPYANGDVHLGTALNKIIKDVVVKRQFMAGRQAPYVPGWDCHGMPIEHQVLKDLASTARTMPQLEIRRRCRTYAEKYYQIQQEQFQRLGVLGDWHNPYLTMSREYEAGIVRMFRRLVEGGFIYRGLRPVHWCPVCSTALAEAEVEYTEHTSPSIYVRFRFHGSPAEARALALNPKDADELATAHDRLSAVIWTTTPWTLPANLAVCFNPHLDYVAVKVGDDYFIVAARLADAFLTAARLSNRDQRRMPITLTALDGKDIFRHPLFDRASRLVFESHVTADVGTGCVHTAPGHGYEDFQVGQKYDLPVLTPVDAEGSFTSQAGVYAGRKVFESNEAIVDDLRASAALVHGEQLSHSYPHCWRCKSPVIFRATEQWFLRIDHADLRSTALAEIDRVAWVPKWGRDRIYHMMETRPDWCLSRQRAWGVPIPVFRCCACGQFHAKSELIQRIEEIFRERGSDAWYELEVRQLLPDGYRCECGSYDFETDGNILDVWFDAACSHDVVLRQRNLGWPADLYVEAVDQHRGWFQVSLVTAVATERRAPYRSVLTHGLILDEAAKKMSKSLGNVVSPDDVITKHGADVLRLLFTSVDFTADTCFSHNLIAPLLDAYRKIRNTCRFLLGNLYDFDPNKDAVRPETLAELDRWILHQGQKLLARSLDAYNNFAFHHVVQGLIHFCAVDLSALYLDIVKDRLYCEGANSKERRSAQTTLYQILETLVHLMTPILSFTAEEIWEHMPKKNGAPESVLLSQMPVPSSTFVNEEIGEKWDRIFRVRGEILKSLEAARNNGNIGHSLDAKVVLYPGTYKKDTSLQSLLNSDGKIKWDDLFIVSQVELDKGEPEESLIPEGMWEPIGSLDSDGVRNEGIKHCSSILGGLIQVYKANGQKCERCWKYAKEVRKPSMVCSRCSEVLKSGASS
ncbi:MAG: isoleucine--tRNA ligase [Candidatus Binatia bacterium]